MFRVGFGDFFLVSVPTAQGAKHILIDCGVHYKDAHSIENAVAQMAQDCGSKLSLLIMTHRHADHISGFARCRDVFSKFTVERVWMSWFEDPSDKHAAAFQAKLTNFAAQLGLALAALAATTNDDTTRQLAAMAENITGGMAAAGVMANQVALNVLHGGFQNKAQYDYYRAGDEPNLPQDLIDAGLSAQILGPPDDPELIKSMTNPAEQYLATGAESQGAPMIPFSDVFRGSAKDYGPKAFKFFSKAEIIRLVDNVQPDVLAAQAMAADKTLNNQSLVILFTFRGKNLLFAGDAQWGNWENFLYGGAYGQPGHTAITDKAKSILGQINFYKVGHHGSANATPKDAVAAMRDGCVGMCSTEKGAYSGVPRPPLLAALSQKMRGQLARSDQVPAGDEAAAADAGAVPSLFKDPTGELFIDYEF